MTARLLAPLYAEHGPVRSVLGNRQQMLAPVARWSPGAKAALIEAIEIGLVAEADAMRAHSISTDELAGWRESLRRGGIPDLRVKSLQIRPYRLPPMPIPSFEEAAARAA